MQHKRLLIVGSGCIIWQTGIEGNCVLYLDQIQTTSTTHYSLIQLPIGMMKN